MNPFDAVAGMIMLCLLISLLLLVAAYIVGHKLGIWWLLVLCIIVSPLAWAQDDGGENNKVSPVSLADGHAAVSKVILGNWQDEDAWRAGILSWLAWMPNNSTNRSLIA